MHTIHYVGMVVLLYNSILLVYSSLGRCRGLLDMPLNVMYDVMVHLSMDHWLNLKDSVVPDVLLNDRGPGMRDEWWETRKGGKKGRKGKRRRRRRRRRMTYPTMVCTETGLLTVW